MRKAKEGIGSKEFMKRSKKGGFWILQVASEVASEVAHITLEQRTVLILSRPSCARNFLPCSLLRAFWNRVVYATLNEGQNWNFTFPDQGLASLKPNSTYMGGEQLKHKAYTHNSLTIDSPLGSI
ncbi:hypothetical protein PIB30_101090, partial [Stylosanthes scabra]|nr:hypothetical protein [Stylosanthes scabra]